MGWQLAILVGAGLRRGSRNGSYPYASPSDTRKKTYASSFLAPERRTMIEKLTIWIAWKLPRRLVMWCAVRVHAHATLPPYGDQVVPEFWLWTQSSGGI